MSDAVSRPGAISRRIDCLTVADDFTHECVDITADFAIDGHYVTQLLERTATFRDECLDENWFESLEQACQTIARWRLDHNEIRLHSRYGRVPPATFAALSRQLTGDSMQSGKMDISISESCKPWTSGV